MIAIKAPQVQYVSHSTVRLFHDEPKMYGNRLDWRGQPTKNGPVAGVVGAVGAISAGLSATGILSGVLIAGGVLGGIGALTGNKTLMAVGSLASLGSGFISAETGAFFNPFGEGAGQSLLSKGLGDTFGSVFDKLKSTLGISSPTDLNPAGSLADKIGGSVGDVASKAATQSAQSIGGGALSDVVGSSALTLPAASAKTAGGGLLGTVLGTPGSGTILAGAASGLSSGLLGMDLSNAQTGAYEANADLTRAKTESEQQAQQLTAQRQQNMQFQDVGNLPTTNQNTQIYKQSPGSVQARVPVTMADGTVQMVTVEQYAAMKSNGG